MNKLYHILYIEYSKLFIISIKLNICILVDISYKYNLSGY